MIHMNEDVLPHFMPVRIIQGLGIGIGTLVLFFFFRWFQKAKNEDYNNEKTFKRFHFFIVYFLVFAFTKWTLYKFFNLHLNTSLVWIEMPNDMLSGYQKVSHFYGQNPNMVTALGIVEISAAILLAIQRTRILGTLMIIFTTINVIVLDLLYQIYSPVPEAIVLCIGACFILYFEKGTYDKGQFHSLSTYLPFSRKTQIALLLSAFIFPLALLSPNYQVHQRPSITGKYEIQDGSSLDYKQFDYLYFDFEDYFVLISSDYKERQIGKYTIDETTREFEVQWVYPDKKLPPLRGVLSEPLKSEDFIINGQMKSDSIQFYLKKIPVHSFQGTF